MNVRRGLLLLPVLLVPGLVVACGSGGAKESPRLTQTQFVSRANRVCIASDRRVYGIGALSTDPAGWSRTARAAGVGIAQMRRLRPPEARRPGFERMLRLGEQLKSAIEDVRDALTKRDYAQARRAQRRATDVDTAIKRQASALGLTFCEQLLTNWPA
jgi:hypothetical protein